MEQKSELESIFSSEKEIILGGQKILIKQIPLGEVPLFSEIASKLFDEKDKKLPMQQKIFNIVKNDFSMIESLFEKLTNLSKEDIKKLNLAATIKIAGEVFKENADFLQHHVAPEIERMAAAVKSLSKSKS